MTSRDFDHTQDVLDEALLAAVQLDKYFEFKGNTLPAREAWLSHRAAIFLALGLAQGAWIERQERVRQRSAEVGA